MKSFARALVGKFSNPVFSLLARSASGRSFLQRSICEAQRHIGIGAGSDVNSSGERVVVDLLRKLRSPGRALCVFDVGANQGDFLKLLLSGLASNALDVHCFEPSITTFALLKANVGAPSGVVLNQFGLGSAAGEFDLFSDREGSGLASLSKRRLDPAGGMFNRQEAVRIRTLDDYCDEKDIQGIDLLKLDVEGHELEVLRGGSRMFTEGKVSAATFEFGGCNVDSRTFLRDFFDFFNSCRMPDIFRILPSGKLHGIRVYSEIYEQFQTTNYLVLKKGRA